MFHTWRILGLYVDVGLVKASIAIWIMWELSNLLMWSLHLAEGKDILISLICICWRKIKLHLQRYLLFNKASEKAIYKDRKPKREFQLEFAFFSPHIFFFPPDWFEDFPLLSLIFSHLNIVSFKLDSLSFTQLWSLYWIGKKLVWVFPYLMEKSLKSESEIAQSCPTLCDPMDCSLPGSLSPCDFPGKNTGMGCHFLLQGKSHYLV